MFSDLVHTYFLGYPLWQWGVVGLIAWACLHWMTRAPKRQNRSTKRWQATRAHQRKLSRYRHQAWKKEAAGVLNRLPKLGADQAQALLNTMSPYAFEYLITEGLQRKGIEIRKIQRASGDGGIDGMAKLDGRWYVIQAKRYQRKVTASMVGDFRALCERKRMPGLFVASSGFSGSAEQLARESRRITLMCGQRLIRLISE